MPLTSTLWLLLCALVSGFDALMFSYGPSIIICPRPPSKDCIMHHCRLTVPTLYGIERESQINCRMNAKLPNIFLYYEPCLSALFSLESVAVEELHRPAHIFRHLGQI